MTTSTITIDWFDISAHKDGTYLQGEYRGMHVELFHNDRLGHAPMAWDWSFYDDASPDPDWAVSRSDEGLPTIEDAERELRDYIDGYVS